MAQLVEFNGEVIEFPDDMTQEEISSVLMSQPTPGPAAEDSGDSPLAVAGEFANAANRAVLGGLDFVGPGFVNAVSSQLGSDFRVPTLEETFIENAPGGGGGFMEEGLARDVVRGAGGAAPAAAGMVPVGRNLGSVGGAAAEFLGLGTKAPTATTAPFRYGVSGMEFAPPGSAAPLDFPESAVTTRTRELIEEGSDKLGRLGKTIDRVTGDVIDEPGATKSLSQGLSEGVTATIQASNRATKGALDEMLDIVDESQKSAKFSVTNRPLDVAGRALGRRYDVIKDANKQARSELDTVARTLQGEGVDSSQAFNDLYASLDDMGIGITEGDSGVELLTRGSDISMLDAPKKSIERLLTRIDEVDDMDAYELHRLKRWIDENVSYGRSQEGLSGKAETVIKTLRRNIDTALDTNFPAYDDVNTRYSETRGMLDEFDRLVASGSGDESPNFEKGVGTLLRRTLSNARSREPILDLVSNMDNMARNYNASPQAAVVQRGALDDDILTEVLFADELDRIFGTNARTSLQGDMSKVVERGMDGAQNMGMMDLAVEAGKKGYDKLRGRNPQRAMRAFRELVQD